MYDRTTWRQVLVDLGRELGDGRLMAILGEGNLSGKLDDEQFLIKASGTSLATLKSEHLVEVKGARLIELIESAADLSDEEMEQELLDARTDRRSLKPSVESLFHAWLLQLPGIQCVGHVHAVAVNQILCSPVASDFANYRLFPDQIVYCGAQSVLLPYVDPGLTLARAIAEEVTAYSRRWGSWPRTILLQNHGIIAIGKSPAEVSAALSMAEKAAQVFIGASALGGPVFMDPYHVERISNRIDEHYRQRMLQA